MYERRFMQRLCNEHIFSIIFGAVKSMRSISPFISGLLIVFVLASSIGFTLTVHTCNHCGEQKIITALTVTGGKTFAAADTIRKSRGHSHNPGEFCFFT